MTMVENEIAKVFNAVDRVVRRTIPEDVPVPMTELARTRRISAQ